MSMHLLAAIAEPLLAFVATPETLHVELLALQISDATGNSVKHSHPTSTEHSNEQPSSPAMLPSSQASDDSITPFPHSEIR
jgi:hypothetical protein